MARARRPARRSSPPRTAQPPQSLSKFQVTFQVGGSIQGFSRYLAPEQSGYCGAAKLSQGMANMDSGTVRIHLHVRARAASDSTPPQDNQTIEKDSEAASSMPEKDPRPPNRSSYSPRFSPNLGDKKHVGSVPGFGFVVFVDAPKLLLVSSHRAECKRVCSISGNIVIPPCASRAPPDHPVLGPRRRLIQ